MKDSELIRIKKVNKKIWKLNGGKKEKRHLSCNYIHTLRVKKLVEANGRYCDEYFLDELNQIIYESIVKYCGLFSGHPNILTEHAAREMFRETS